VSCGGRWIDNRVLGAETGVQLKNGQRAQRFAGERTIV
jgi:hypothetical protein